MGDRRPTQGARNGFAYSEAPPPHTPSSFFLFLPGPSNIPLTVPLSPCRPPADLCVPLTSVLSFLCDIDLISPKMLRFHIWYLPSCLISTRPYALQRQVSVWPMIPSFLPSTVPFLPSFLFLFLPLFHGAGHRMQALIHASFNHQLDNSLNDRRKIPKWRNCLDLVEPWACLSGGPP